MQLTEEQRRVAHQLSLERPLNSADGAYYVWRHCVWAVANGYQFPFASGGWSEFCTACGMDMLPKEATNVR